MAGMPTFIQGSLVYTGDSWNQLFSQANDIRTRKLQDAYSIVNLSWGIEREAWSTELFVRNVFDERAAVFINGGSWDSRVTANRPRTIGLRFRQKFD
jgi:outer membrane receptor protein involved in Fe transport